MVVAPPPAAPKLSLALRYWGQPRSYPHMRACHAGGTRLLAAWTATAIWPASTTLATWSISTRPQP